MKTIVIAGGTGFIGQALEKHLSNNDYQVKILSRNPKRDNEIYWNAKDLNTWTSELENVEALINLTGKTINCKFTDVNKQLIKKSRVSSTLVLGKAINLCKNPPKIWMNSSTTSIYKESYDALMSEENNEIGEDFENEVATVWENTFNTIESPKTRKIILRTSIVLGKHGGAFPTLKRLSKLGLGGKQGNGKQKVSWIHKHDFVKAVEFLLSKENLSGAFNLCVPKSTNNNTMMKSLRKVLKVPFGLNSPKPILKLGALFLGTESELVLKSRNVIPKRLLDNGFQFQFQYIEDTLLNLIDK